MEDQKKFNVLLEKVEQLKKTGQLDLSTEEDLAIGVMNLIALEEHFFFTGVKTKKDQYFELLDEVRTMRKELLGKMINKLEGETWCAAKHLLAATMRLMEVGTKLQADQKKEEAKDMFLKAERLFGIFWALRLKMVEAAAAHQTAKDAKPWTMHEIWERLVDCCDE